MLLEFTMGLIGTMQVVEDKEVRTGVGCCRKREGGPCTVNGGILWSSHAVCIQFLQSKHSGARVRPHVKNTAYPALRVLCASRDIEACCMRTNAVTPRIDVSPSHSIDATFYMVQPSPPISVATNNTFIFQTSTNIYWRQIVPHARVWLWMLVVSCHFTTCRRPLTRAHNTLSLDLFLTLSSLNPFVSSFICSVAVRCWVVYWTSPRQVSRSLWYILLVSW